MAGKLLRNLKQIGTICFAIFCLVFPNFSWANCTDDTYRMKFEDGNWLYQKCTGGNWVSDQSPGHYSCGAGTNIPDSTNDAKIWSGKIWDDDQNLYAYWRGPGKKLDSEGFALTEDVCIGCTRNEYYDTEEDYTDQYYIDPYDPEYYDLEDSYIEPYDFDYYGEDPYYQDIYDVQEDIVFPGRVPVTAPDAFE